MQKSGKRKGERGKRKNGKWKAEKGKIKFAINEPII
jgi:hypothetical protein